VKPDPFSVTCPACGSHDVLHHGCIHRLWREVPIGPKPVVIQMSIPRLECRKCTTIRQVAVGFADERRSYIRAFARYALELSRYMTIRDVARHLNVGWDLIREIKKRYLQKHFSRPKLSKRSQLAIDEISVGKGQKYLTVVLDLTTGAVVFVGDGNPAVVLAAAQAQPGAHPSRGDGHVQGLYPGGPEESAGGQHRL
jgi:transposase